MAGQVHLINHPLIAHKLTIMRNKETSTRTFRNLLEEVGTLLGYELTREMATVEVEIETPLVKTKAPKLDGKKICIIAVLRAGIGMLDGFVRILPSARIGHIGMYRDHETLEAVEYYFKVPQEMSHRDAIVVDPMLATGNSAIAAVTRLKETNPRSIKFACLVAAPEGIEAFHKVHPDVPIYTPAIDDCLNEKGYIVPGLGDAGDRLFGTK